MQKLNTVLLIDDDDATNFMNRRILTKMELAEQIVVTENGRDALDYLTKATNPTEQKATYPQPELIFVDINMPVMNGWEFLDAYEKLPIEQKGKIVVVMLTTSLNYHDEELAKSKNMLTGFLSKPLKKSDVVDLLAKHFKDFELN